MTSLLETDALLEGLSSIGVVSCASALLQFVDDVWLQDEPFIPCNLGIPSQLRKPLVVRILSLIGLTMNLDEFRHGDSLPSFG